MTPDPRRQLIQAAQWLRLRELQRRQADAQVQQARDRHHTAWMAVEAAHERVAALQVESLALRQAQAEMQRAAHPSSTGLVRWSLQAHARREYLDEQRERADYALIDAQARCDTAAAQLDLATAALRHARAHEDTARAAWQQGRRQARAVAERTTDDPPAPLTPGLSLRPPGVLR